ncbi:restriction endonuclease subunit S, partial [Francisella philomiragia]
KFHCLCNSNGSTVLHMSKKAIPSYIFKLPPKELLASFTKIVDDIFEKQDLNQKQIKTLEQTRDTLLPKLMSGQVRV